MLDLIFKVTLISLSGLDFSHLKAPLIFVLLTQLLVLIVYSCDLFFDFIDLDLRLLGETKEELDLGFGLAEDGPKLMLGSFDLIPVRLFEAAIVFDLGFDFMEI